MNALGALKCRSSPAGQRERGIKDEGLRRGECVRILTKHFRSIPRRAEEPLLHVNTSVGSETPLMKSGKRERKTNQERRKCVWVGRGGADAAFTLWTFNFISGFHLL